MPSMTVPVIARALGAGAIGVYTGAAAAGLITLAEHPALVLGSTWLRSLPVLALLGVPTGAAFARVNRRWLLPDRPRRTLLIVLLGAATLPLFAATGQFPPTPAIETGSIVAGWAAATALWARHHRRPADRDNPASHQNGTAPR